MSCKPSWICTLCGYMYGTPQEDLCLFEDLNDGWSCPDCSAEKEMFALCECVSFSNCSDGRCCASRANEDGKKHKPEQVNEFLGSLGSGVNSSTPCSVFSRTCSMLDKWKEQYELLKEENETLCHSLDDMKHECASLKDDLFYEQMVQIAQNDNTYFAEYFYPPHEGIGDEQRGD